MIGGIGIKKMNKQGSVLLGLRRIGLDIDDFLQKITGKFHIKRRHGGFPVQFLLKNHHEALLPPVYHYQVNSFIITRIQPIDLNLQLYWPSAYFLSRPAARDIVWQRNELHSLSAGHYAFNLKHGRGRALFNIISRNSSFIFLERPVTRKQLTSIIRIFKVGYNLATARAAILAPSNIAIVPKTEIVNRELYYRMFARSCTFVPGEKLFARRINRKRLLDQSLVLEKNRNLEQEEFFRRENYIASERAFGTHTTHRNITDGRNIVDRFSTLDERSSLDYRNILAWGNIPAQKDVLTHRNKTGSINGLAKNFKTVGNLSFYPAPFFVSNNTALVPKTKKTISKLYSRIFARGTAIVHRETLHRLFDQTMVFEKSMKLEREEFFQRENNIMGEIDTSILLSDLKIGLSHEKIFAHRKILNSRRILDYSNRSDYSSIFDQRKVYGDKKLYGYGGNYRYGRILNDGRIISREAAVYPDQGNTQQEVNLQTILNRHFRPKVTNKDDRGEAAYPPFRMDVATAPLAEAFKLKAAAKKEVVNSNKPQLMEIQSNSRLVNPVDVIETRHGSRQTNPVDVNRIADQVYQIIERKIRIERERRGM